jgi:hypothetical protein
MNSLLYSKSREAIFGETRNRAAELYFNGSCLLRAVSRGQLQKVSFFLRRLWCAVAE